MCTRHICCACFKLPDEATHLPLALVDDTIASLAHELHCCARTTNASDLIPLNVAECTQALDNLLLAGLRQRLRQQQAPTQHVS